MSVISKNPKEFVLDPRFDNSDPTTKTSFEEICKKLDIGPQRLNQLLPVRKFPREKEFILGIKLKDSSDDIPIKITYSACPVVSIDRSDLEEVPEKQLITSSEPEESLYELKESGRITNNKIAEKYKSISSLQQNKKKEVFQDWFKSRIWRNYNGSLEKVTCPVCSDSMISPDSFSAGHILPESKGGMMCLENIMPICSECNSQMGTRHLYWFAWHYYGKVMWSVY